MNSTRLLVSAVAGAALGLLAGFTVFSVGHPISVPLTMWLTNPNLGRPADAVLWTLLGAVVVAGLTYALTRNSN